MKGEIDKVFTVVVEQLAAEYGEMTWKIKAEEGNKRLKGERSKASREVMIKLETKCLPPRLTSAKP